MVANHTSFIDVIVLLKDSSYSLVGQRHGGMFGLIQSALSRGGKGHLWFERKEKQDRALVRRRLLAHVRDPDTNPVLVFPEGTCVNNDYCVMFRKGIFEMGVPVYPIAIKYNRNFADAYWESRRHGFCGHLLNLMTSWAVVADAWYLPAATIAPGEDAAQFAMRVKRAISARANLVNVNWNGYLKRERLGGKHVRRRQRRYVERVLLRRRSPIPNGMMSRGSYDDLQALGQRAGRDRPGGPLGDLQRRLSRERSWSSPAGMPDTPDGAADAGGGGGGAAAVGGVSEGMRAMAARKVGGSASVIRLDWEGGGGRVGAAPRPSDNGGGGDGEVGAAEAARRAEVAAAADKFDPFKPLMKKFL